MFFCESCREQRDWPESIMKSRGNCELCGEPAVCHDVPSRFLPIPRMATRRISEVPPRKDYP